MATASWLRLMQAARAAITLMVLAAAGALLPPPAREVPDSLGGSGFVHFPLDQRSGRDMTIEASRQSCGDTHPILAILPSAEQRTAIAEGGMQYDPRRPAGKSMSYPQALAARRVSGGSLGAAAHFILLARRYSDNNCVSPGSSVKDTTRRC